MKIIKLSELKIKQIAAGEVIAHPFNAIKELIENAIDAKANIIDIYIKDCGLEQIIVKDNGIGMNEDDLKICKEMHTTSKTNEEEQFFGANSLGFRGEALASIDSISNMIIESNGKKLINNSLIHSTLAQGTLIEINNLFFNTPARLKFIKKNTALKKIKEIIKQYAACYYNIEFNFFNNERKILNFFQTTLEERLIQLFKCSELKHFEYKANNLKIKCYVSTNTLNEEMIFINNRPIKNPNISAYIKSIFCEYYMKHEFPSYALFIEIDPIFCDFNIHPNKLEVKILSYEEIFAILIKNLNQEFFKKTLSTSLHNNFQEQFKQNFSTPSYIPKTNVQEEKTPILLEENIALNFSLPQEVEEFHFKIIGQLKNSYILFETNEGIGIFDQHAAHERKVYEEMKQELKKENMQKLLFPIQLKLNQEQKELIQNNNEKFENKGIKIENNYITHLPTILHHLNSSIFFECFEENIEFDIAFERILANIACKNALKANTKLSFEQMHALLSSALKNIPVCNHGRPSFRYFSLNEIECWFKRK